MTVRHAFTLLELLIAIALLSLISTLTTLQSIGTYQAMIKRLHEVEQSALQKAQEGKTYRHIRQESTRGVSTIEILVALAVMTVSITASITVGIGVPNIIADARNAAIAIEKAHVALLDPSSVSISNEPLEDENFSRWTSQQEWITARSIVRTTKLQTTVGSGGQPEACDPFTSGDWSHPVLVQSYALDGSLGLPTATYSVSSLSISPGELAVGIGSTSEAARPTLLLFGLMGTSSPRLLGAFDNASTSRIGNSEISSNGTYVFSGNAFSSASSATCGDAVSCAHINIYTRSGLASSLILATTTEPFAYRADGSNAPVSAISWHQGFLYVGLQKTVRGYEFNIIDAHDPTHLHWVSGYPIGRTVNNITVRDGLAYASTDDPSRELMVFDVHNPARPVLYSVWDAPGASTFGYGSASTVYGDGVRFGRTYSANGPEFELLQVRDASMTEIAHIDSGTTKDPESVRALLTQDRLTFMLLTHRLDVLDTHDHVTARLVGSYQFPPDSRSTALACRNNQLYLARIESDGSGHIDILQGS